MAKLFESSADVIELAENKFDETTLSDLGINLKVISTAKAKTNCTKTTKQFFHITPPFCFQIKPL